MFYQYVKYSIGLVLNELIEVVLGKVGQGINVIVVRVVEIFVVVSEERRDIENRRSERIVAERVGAQSLTKINK